MATLPGVEPLLLALAQQTGRIPTGPFTAGFAGDGSADVEVVAAQDDRVVFVESISIIPSADSDGLEVSSGGDSIVGPFDGGARVQYDFGPFATAEGDEVTVVPASGVALGGTVTWWIV